MGIEVFDFVEKQQQPLQMLGQLGQPLVEPLARMHNGPKLSASSCRTTLETDLSVAHSLVLPLWSEGELRNDLQLSTANKRRIR
jgi:hypothetical protein